MRSSLMFVAVGVGGLLWICGCGGGGSNLPPVTGGVTIDKQIVAEFSGFVSFHPEAAGKVVPMGAAVGGSYHISTDGNAGAPLGKYKVTISTDSTKKRLIDAKYEDVAKTPLTIEVVANPAPGAYDLKLTSK